MTRSPPHLRACSTRVRSAAWKTSRRGAPAGAEDCLYLNVYAPRSATPGTGRLPVMVWIHGGGNVVGHAGFFDGGNLAAREDVVVVTINYRLGPFGWFRHPALRDAGASELDRSGNFGTLDQVRALEWVRDNAAAFGGDPGNVTVFGESAGGTNVFALLLAPPARGLFHRAIVESGNLSFGAPATAEGFVDDPQPSHPNASGEALPACWSRRVGRRIGWPPRRSSRPCRRRRPPRGFAASPPTT